MTIQPIRSDDDLRAAFKQLELVLQAPAGSEQADEREVLVTLIEAYEQKHYPIGPAMDWVPTTMPISGGPDASAENTTKLISP